MRKLTAIVPNYNHERFLDQRIQSVLHQTYSNIEVVLLDDASTDGSLEVLAKYRLDPRVKETIVNSENTGSPFKQWNRGVATATGDYIWIAESDDFADPRLAETLVAVLDANPRVGVAYSQSLAVDENNKLLYSLAEWTKDLHSTRWDRDFVNCGTDECSTYLALKCTIPNASAAIFRKSVYDDVGGADENFRLAGDWMLWAKLLLVADVAFVAQPLNCFRVHAHTARKSAERGAIGVFEGARILAYIAEHSQISPAVHDDACDGLLNRWLDQLARRRYDFSTNLAIYLRLRAIDDRLHRRLGQRMLKKLKKGTFGWRQRTWLGPS